MGINLGGTTAWAVDDRIEPGSYVAKSVTVERMKSSNKNEQVQVDWRVMGGQYKGAEQRDWITFTESAMGRVVQVIEAIGEQVPQQDFASYGELADWLAEILKKGAVTEMVIRLEPGRKDPSKEFPTIAGYRKPNPSDVPADTSGFSSGPKVNGNGAGADDKSKLPFAFEVIPSFAELKSHEARSL